MGPPQPLVTPDFAEDLDRIIEWLLEVEGELKRKLDGSWRILQDLRWDLIALRGEVEDPGDAPVFDNPQALLEYLKTTHTYS